MPKHESINYLEFPCRDLQGSKAFFEACFEWKFVDYGPDYASFSQPSIDGGFFTSDQVALAATGSALVIFYSEALELTHAKVEKCGGTISQPIFSFPGGRRFHFTDPSGNEFAVWSDVGDETK